MTDIRVPVSLEDTNSSLIRSLGSSSFSNTGIFDQIQNFYFELSLFDFERLSRPMSFALVAKLSDAYEYINKSKEEKIENSVFFKKILSLLLFLGYKVWNSTSNTDNIKNMMKCSSLIGFSELALLSKIIRKSFEQKNNNQTYSNDLINSIMFYFPYAIKRADTILSHPKEIGHCGLIALESTLLLLPNFAKMNEKFNREFLSLIIKHCNILSDDLCDKTNLIHYSSFVHCINKICILTPIKSIDSKKFKNRTTQIMEKLAENIPKTSNTLLVETFKTMLFLIKTDKINAKEFIENIMKILCDFNEMNSNAFLQFADLAKHLMSIINQIKDNTRKVTEMFCIFAVNSLTYQDINLLQRNNIFYSMISYIKIQSRGEERWKILELFFMAFYLQMKEISLIIKDIGNNCSCNKLRLLYTTMDSFNKVIVFFDAFPKNTKDSGQNAQGTSVFFDPMLNQRVSQIISMIFAEILYNIDLCAKTMNSMDNCLKEFNTSDDYDENVERLITYNKNIELFKVKVQGLHKKNIYKFIDSTNKAPHILIDVAWKLFLDRFFHNKENLTFDTCLFWTLTNYEKGKSFTLYPLTIFLKNLSSYVEDHITNSSMIEIILESMKSLFIRIVTKPSIAAKRQNQIELLNNSVLKIIHISKSLINSRKHSSNALQLIIAVSSYLDYVYGNDMFSCSVYSLKTVQEILEKININKESASAICKFVEITSSKVKEIRTSSFTIDTLIRSTPYCQDKALKLLKQAYKANRTIYINSKLTERFAEYLYSQIDVTEGETKKLIIKTIHCLPENIVTDKFDPSPFIANQRVFSFKIKEQNVDVQMEKLYKSVYNGLRINTEDENAWKLFAELTKTMFTPSNIDIEYRRSIHIIINEAFSLLPKNCFWNNFMMTFIDTLDENNIVMAASHILVAYLSVVEEDEDSENVCKYILKHFTTVKQVSSFINEVMLLISVNEITDSYVIESICITIIEHIEKELIDPIDFSNLVILMTNEMTSPKKRDIQKIDDTMNFMELSILSKKVRTIIKFARDNLKEHKITDISPLLNTTKTSTNFLTNLVVSEIISEYESNKKIVDLSSIIDSFGSDDLSLFKVTGTLFRALPKSFSCISKSVIAIADQKLEDINNRDEKYQTFFMTFMVPILMKTKDNITKYKPVLKIAFRSFTRPFTFIKCQAQLIIKMFYTEGDAKTKEEIDSYCDSLLKERLPDLPITTYSNIRWRFVTGSLFSVLFIKTAQVVDNMNNYLEMFPSADSDKLIPCTDLYDNLVALFNIVSSEFIKNHLKGRGIFETFSWNLVRVYSICPMLQLTELSELLANYFEGSETAFLNIISAAFEDDITMLSALCPLAKQKQIKEYLIDYVNQNKDTIVEIISAKETEKAFLVAKLLVILEYKDDEIMNQIIEMHKYMTHIFKESLSAFDCNLYLELTQFICKNDPKFFLFSTEYIFEQFQPMLNEFFFDAFDDFFDTKRIKASSIKKILSSYSTKENALSLIIHILKIRKDLTNNAIENIVENVDTGIALKFLNKMVDYDIGIDYSLFDMLQIYDSCQTDDERINALLFWSKSKSEDNFTILFNNTCSHVNLFIDLRIEKIFTVIKVPKTSVPTTIAATILNLFDTYSRNPLISTLLFYFISNNKEIFPNVTKTFISQIHDHLRYLETMSPKQDLKTKVTLFRNIVKCISLDDLTEQEVAAFNMHTTMIGAPLVKSFVNNPESLIKFKNEAYELIATVGDIAKLFPSSSLPIMFIEMFNSYSLKINDKAVEKTANDPYIFGFLFEYITLLIEGLTQNTELASLNNIIDIYSNDLQNKESHYWHYSILALSTVLKNQKWKEKTMDRIRYVFTHENLKRTLPMQWRFSKKQKERSYVNALNLAKSILLQENNGSLPTGNIILHNVLLNCTPQIESYIISQLLSPEVGYFETYILEEAFTTCFKDTIFTRRCIDCLKNQKLADVFFNRVIPSEEIINKLPLEALLVLATKEKVPKLALERIHSFPFKEVLFVSATTNRYTVPFVRVLSSITGLDLTSITPFFEANDLIENSLSITENKEVAEISAVLGINVLSKKLESQFSPHVLSEFPEFEDSQIEEISAAKIFAHIGMIQSAVKELGNIDCNLDNEQGRRILSEANFGGHTIIDIIKEDTSIEDKLDNIFSLYNTMQETTTRKSFGEYLIIHEVKKIAKDIKKHSEGFKAFSFKLKPVHSTALHIFYKKVRDASKSNFTIEDSSLIENFHTKAYRKAFEYSTHEIKKNESSELFKDVEHNLSKIMTSLLNEKDAPQEMRENAAIALYKINPKSVRPFLLLLQNYKKCNRLIKKIISSGIKIPFEVSSSIAKLIAKDDSLSPLIALLHPALYIQAHLLGCNIPFEHLFGIRSFINSVKEVSTTETVKIIQKVNKNGMRLIDSIRGKCESLPKEFNRKCCNLSDEILSLHSSCLLTTTVEQLYPPLLKDCNSRGRTLTFIHNSQFASEVVIRLSLINGDNVMYTLTSNKLMSTRVSLLANVLTKMLRKSPGSYRKGQELLSLASINVCKGYYLTKTQSEPIFGLDSIQTLIAANSGDEIKKEPKRYNYRTKAEFAYAFSLFGTRYAALTLSYLMLGGAIPLPNEVSVDLRNSSFAFAKLTNDGEEHSVPRLCGKVTDFIDETVARGPFRIGILTAANCFVQNKEKIKATVSSIFKDDKLVEKIAPVIDQYSPITTKPTEALNTINSLINSFYNYNESFAIPWI